MTSNCSHLTLSTALNQYRNTYAGTDYPYIQCHFAAEVFGSGLFGIRIGICNMGKKLFVSNLDFEISADQVREMFAGFGSVVSAVLAMDRETRRSKGFAFVEMAASDEADKAVADLNNKIVNGRPMKVAEDRGKTSTSAPGASASSSAPGATGSVGGGAIAATGSDEGGGGKRRFEPLPAIQRTQLFRRRKKMDPFIEDPTKTIDFRDVSMLSKFITERGRIMGRRLTGLTAFNQRKLTKAIKRAQSLGLMPYANV